MARQTDRVDVLFVQSNPSQLDEPFYDLLFQKTGRIGLALFNADSRDRRTIDPELGFVPEFPKVRSDVPVWLFNAEEGGVVDDATRAILQLRPKLVVLQDQSWSTKIRIALQCRRAGIRVAMRSDKNFVSTTARHGPMRKLEGKVVRALFDKLAPVSRLTCEYYGWPDSKASWPFPYPTLAGKFARGGDDRGIRNSIRACLGIERDATVFLVVAKFVPRENPGAAIRAFAQTSINCNKTALIVVGAGRLEGELKAMADVLAVSDRIRFVGYVRYAELHRYFWASDVLVHLPQNEPWGVSVQDALVADMAVVASTRVGAALCHLEGPLGRYLVEFGDIDLAARRMIELCESRGGALPFAAAKTKVLQGFSVEALASEWARRMKAL